MNQFGCINIFGKVLIPLIYDKVYDYSEGFIGVEFNNKLGFVDTNGTTIIPLIYETSGSDFSGVFYDGLAGLILNDKFGFIDKNGKTIIPFIYDEGGRFSEGLANVSSSDKWGFIDKKGKVVIPLKFEYVDCFSEGFATYGARVSGRNRYGIINKKAEIILAPSDYKGIGRFSSGLTWAEKAENNKMVCLDKKGNQAFSKIFGDCDFFKSGNNEKYFSIGLSPICSDENKYGFVNKKGEVIIPYKNSSATVFNNGFSLVSINWIGPYFYIDKNGKEYKD